ncbi:MAG TPA: sensor domain-containing diguanylate cyclase [Thermoanaerobaculia bacterium]
MLVDRPESFGGVRRTSSHDTGSPAKLRRTRVAAGAAVALAIGIAFAALHTGESRAREQLEQRFQGRVEIAVPFIRAYVMDILERERLVAEERFTAKKSPRSDFDSIVSALGLEAAVIVSGRGTLVMVHPHREELVGHDIAAEYEHLRTALERGSAVSNVVGSAAAGTPIVAFASRYRHDANEWRVFSGAFNVGKSPLGPFLRNLVPIRGTSSDLIDETGNIVASARWSGPGGISLTTLDPALASAVAGAQSGSYRDGANERVFVVSTVADTPWRLVASVDEQALYAPISGTPKALAWLLLVAFSAISILAGAQTVRILEQRAELGKMNQHLDRVARLDALTGVPNRRHLDEELRSLFSGAVRHRQALSVLIIDIDHFKRVNDQHGHGVGDEVLSGMAATMSAVLRREDVFGRWGGEEFLALLPNTGAAGAHLTAERIRHAAAAWRLALDGTSIAATVSIGGATLRCVDDQALVVTRADNALYTAKEHGRNRVVFDSADLFDDEVTPLATAV